MILWLCFEGVNIFHQIFFSIDVIYTLQHRLAPNYKILICTISALVLFPYILLEIYFMYYIIQLYQSLVEREIENLTQQNNMNRTTIVRSVRTPHPHVIERTERNNPMQSSIIKLLETLESNNDTSDTASLIK